VRFPRVVLESVGGSEGEIKIEMVKQSKFDPYAASNAAYVVSEVGSSMKMFYKGIQIHGSCEGWDHYEAVVWK